MFSGLVSHCSATSSWYGFRCWVASSQQPPSEGPSLHAELALIGPCQKLAATWVEVIACWHQSRSRCSEGTGRDSCAARVFAHFQTGQAVGAGVEQDLADCVKPLREVPSAPHSRWLHAHAAGLYDRSTGGSVHVLCVSGCERK